MNRQKELYYHYGGIIARFGNRIITGIAIVLVFTMMIYGCYSIYNSWQIFQGAYLNNDIAKLKPTENNLSLEELQKINSDVIGWITIDDTNIDYPFVQGKDNMEYINKDIYGDFALSGSIFMDYRNSKDISDHYHLLYGHHMSYSAMFGDIEEFNDDDFLNKHHSGILITEGKKFKIELFAFVICFATDEKYFDVRPMNQTEFCAKLDEIKKDAKTYRSIKLNGNDQIIALSTCFDTHTNGRMILFGKLIRDS